MGGIGLIFTPVLVRSFLGPPGLSRPITGTSWTHSYSKQSNWVVYRDEAILLLFSPIFLSGNFFIFSLLAMLNILLKV